MDGIPIDSPTLNKCCYCEPSALKCYTDQCPCFMNGLICAEHCDYPKMSDFCLNRPITVCQCKKDDSNSYNEAQENGKKKLRRKSKVEQHKSENICLNNSCLCSKFKEACSELCQCKAECKNNSALPNVDLQEPPATTCKCKSGRKSCSKDEKCPCRNMLHHCSPLCKCKGSCNNNSQDGHLISKSAKLCLVQPDQESSVCIVRLAGEEYDYQFTCQTDRISGEHSHHPEELAYERLMPVFQKFKLPIKRISIFLSRSPCYHQYCEPECQIIDECFSNKSCSGVLSIMARQIMRTLRNTNVLITMRMLAADTARGDLYTSTGISNMLQAGINVEPFSMIDWSHFIFDKHVDMEKHGGDGSHDQEETFYQQARVTWETCQMDFYVRHMQHYINKGRATMGLKKSYWSSKLHDIFKFAVEISHESKDSFDELFSKLEMLQKRFKSTNTLNSRIMPLNQVPFPIEPIETAEEPKRKKSSTLKKRSSSQGPPIIQKTRNLAVFHNKCKEDQDIDLQPSSSTRRLSAASVLSLHRFEKPSNYYNQRKSKSQQNIDRLVLAVSSRNIVEEEKHDMVREVADHVEDIRKRLERFIDWLELRITSTSL